MGLGRMNPAGDPGTTAVYPRRGTYTVVSSPQLYGILALFGAEQAYRVVTGDAAPCVPAEHMGPAISHRVVVPEQLHNLGEPASCRLAGPVAAVRTFSSEHPTVRPRLPTPAAVC